MLFVKLCLKHTGYNKIAPNECEALPVIHCEPDHFFSPLIWQICKCKCIAAGYSESQ